LNLKAEEAGRAAELRNLSQIIPIRFNGYGRWRMEWWIIDCPTNTGIFKSQTCRRTIT